MPSSNFFTEIGEDDKRTNIISTISSPLWSSGTATLTAFYTSSVQSGSSGNYYYDVYDKAASDNTRQVQFAVSYGHVEGSGSLSTSAGNNPSKAIYRQFRNISIKNPQSETKFAFPEDNTMTFPAGKDVFVISINRARYREKMDPGNWELRLVGGGATATNTLRLIDDSGATADSTVKASQRVFNVVSGSISDGSSQIKVTADAQKTLLGEAGSYALFYPELGTIVLNAEAISGSAVGVSSARGYDISAVRVPRASAANSNTAYELVQAIQSGSYFQGRREEQIKSSHYFCRVLSNEYNYSQNPTYYSGSDATLRNPTFVQDPKSYITTVGLYNDNNELLAVAKLSQPLLKSKDREAVIKVRLDF